MRAGFSAEAANLSDEQIQALVTEQGRRFQEEAPTSAAEAATVILDGVKAERWRVLVGADAHTMDEYVRSEPEQAYEPDFFTRMTAANGWRLGG